MPREGHPLIFSKMPVPVSGNAAVNIFHTVFVLNKHLIFVFSVLFSVSLLFLNSCEELQVETGISVSDRQVTYQAGQVTVNVTASGEWVLSLYYQGIQDGWASLSQTSGRGSKDGIVLNYDENSTSETRSLYVILTNRGDDYAVTFVQLNEEDSGWVGTYPGWLELPAVVENDDCRFYTHDMKLGSGKMSRNYSFLWDRDNLVSHWVAYPLNKGLIGSGSRTDDWGYDPEVPYEDQPRLERGYKGGYDRGHQIPSADRLSYAANQQTFYYTNMTPQIGSGFNQRIWASLETKVRSIAMACDTLYVVTGCIVDGSTEVAYDNDNREVTVPVAYYKALLRYSDSSSAGISGYSAAAFYLDHRSYSETNVTEDMLMPVDELEDITGLDFFANLPGKIGGAQADLIESEDPRNVSFWLN